MPASEYNGRYAVDDGVDDEEEEEMKPYVARNLVKHVTSK